MKKFLFVLMTLFFSIQSAMASGVDAFMDKHVAPVSDAVARVIFYPVNICNNEVPLIIFWILFAGIFFTISAFRQTKTAFCQDLLKAVADGDMM